MIEEAAVLTRIAEFLRLEPGELKSDSVLADVVRDSFLLVELVIELQEATGAHLTRDDLATVRTAGDLAGLVARQAPA